MRLKNCVTAWSHSEKQRRKRKKKTFGQENTALEEKKIEDLISDFANSMDPVKVVIIQNYVKDMTLYMQEE